MVLSLARVGINHSTTAYWSPPRVYNHHGTTEAAFFSADALAQSLAEPAPPGPASAGRQRPNRFRNLSYTPFSGQRLGIIRLLARVRENVHAGGQILRARATSHDVLQLPPRRERIPQPGCTSNPARRKPVPNRLVYKTANSEQKNP